MACKSIITIAREFGSGGRLIGKKLADELEIAFYDRELITLAAKEAGVDPSVFNNVDERAVNSLLYALSMGMYNMGNTFSPLNSMPENDRLYIAQHKVINEIAQKGPCVIVGRCADYILRERHDCIRVFIHAPLEARIKRATSIYEIPNEKANETVKKTDKTRANYYSFYTSQRWGETSNYDLCIDSTKLTIEQNARLIKNFVELREEN